MPWELSQERSVGRQNGCWWGRPVEGVRKGEHVDDHLGRQLDADGLAASTIDGVEILTINGTQTLSSAYSVLLSELGTLREAGVTHFRLSPQDVDMVQVAEVYRDMLDGKRHAAEALQTLRSITGDFPYVNGFLHGREGLAWSETSACLYSAQSPDFRRACKQ